MKTGHWSVAFTIVVSDLQVDFMELPEQNRIEILKCLIVGETEGTLSVPAGLDWYQNVS